MVSKLKKIGSEELSKVRSFTLTSGYDSENTRFVRVKDGYNVGADPALVRKTNNGAHSVECLRTGKKIAPGGEYWDTHHVRHEGHVYRCHPGYVMATLKEGRHGWSDVVETPEGHVLFNPWEDKRVDILWNWDNGWEIQVTRISTGENMYPDREVKDIGRWVILERSGAFSVKSPIFKGLRTLLQRLRHRPYGFDFHYGGRSFDNRLTRIYDMGEVIQSKKPLTLEEVFFNWNREYQMVVPDDHLVKVYYKRHLNSMESRGLVVIGEHVLDVLTNNPSSDCSLNLAEILNTVCVERILGERPVIDFDPKEVEDQGWVCEERKLVYLFVNC